MNKSLIALATAAAVIAATMSQAEAGFRIGIGFGVPIGLGAFSHNHGSYQAPRRVYRAERAPVRARKAQPTAVAKDEVEKVEKSIAQNENSSITVAAVNVANTENSSITVASTDEAKTVEPVKTAETKKSEPAVAQKLDCKKFFPSVGLTLTVPCE